MSSNHDRRYHLHRLRELESRMLACQSAESEETIQKQIDAENARWKSLQQTNDKEEV